MKNETNEKCETRIEGRQQNLIFHFSFVIFHLLTHRVTPQRWNERQLGLECRSHERACFNPDKRSTWQVGLAAVFKSGECLAGFTRQDHGPMTTLRLCGSYPKKINFLKRPECENGGLPGSDVPVL